MERIGRRVKHYEEITEIYKYTDLKEREEHLEYMQLDDWEVLKTDRREELGYPVIYQKTIEVN